MFARLILALLLAAFALPALANGPCHDAPARAMIAAMPAHHGPHHLPTPDERATVPHVCIGCIPPASLAMRALPARPVRPELPRGAPTQRFDRLVALPPALPPPRSAA